jgi:hypothetical protein
MKKIIFILGLLLFVSTASASIGTFTGELEKQGPEAEFTVGLASDQPLQVELEVQKVEGLNISYNQSFRFNPENVERSYQRGDEILPVREYSVRVGSLDVEKEAYNIPMTFRAYSDQDQFGTSPQVIHEREYDFRYVTDLSESYGWNGSLIDGEEGSEEPERPEEEQSDETLDLDENGSENTLTTDNETIDGEKEQSSGNRTTLILLVMILFLSVYILREALG